MKKILSLLALITLSLQSTSFASEDNFDVLGSVMDNTKKEISAKSVLNSNKEDAEKFREKIVTGWWEFMQASSNAKPGEYCAAMFLRAKRDQSPGGIDNFKEGVSVTLFGPGGNYRGALLAFTPLDDNHAFPNLQNGKPIKVTLRQGNETPSTLNAIYFDHVGKAALPMITFAVPSIEALMAGMEDKWIFEVIYKGQSISNIVWHSGFKARDELKKCLAGKPFDNKSHLRD